MKLPYVEFLKSAPNLLPREILPLSEYRAFPTEKLQLRYLTSLEARGRSESSFSLSIERGGALKGFLLFEFQPYDSKVFGRRFYRLTGFALYGDDDAERFAIAVEMLSQLDLVAKERRMGYVNVSLNTNVPTSTVLFNALVEHGFYYIQTLLTFHMARKEFRRDVIPLQRSDNIEIRRATPADQPQIRELAATSYRIDRFHLDPNLPDDLCDTLHAESAQSRVVDGFADIVFVADRKGELLGYYSGSKHHDAVLDVTLGTALISAVSEKARHRGIFTSMNAELLGWFAEHTDFAEMGTYVTNVAVHRIWTKSALGIVRASHQLARFFG